MKKHILTSVVAGLALAMNAPIAASSSSEFYPVPTGEVTFTLSGSTVSVDSTPTWAEGFGFPGIIPKTVFFACSSSQIATSNVTGILQSTLVGSGCEVSFTDEDSTQYFADGDLLGSFLDGDPYSVGATSYSHIVAASAVGPNSGSEWVWTSSASQEYSSSS